MNRIVNRRDMLRVSAIAATTFTLGPTTSSFAQTAQINAVVPEEGSRLDAGDVQLFFGDLQVGLVAGSKTVAPEALSRSAGVLASVAEILDLPMLFSVVTVANGSADIIPGLEKFSNSSNTLKRTPIGPFHDPQTVAALARNNRKTLIVSGFAAEAVVLQAALDAIAAGYRTYYVVDAIGSQSDRTEAAAFSEMDRAGAIATSTLSLTTRLVPDFVGTPGAAVFRALGPVMKL